MKKIINKALFIITLIPILLILLVVLPFIISPIINSITLSGFAKQINNIPLPAGTELIEKEAICGKLNGNGNGMDFFACILIKSDMTINQIKKYYEERKYKAAKSDKDHVVDTEIVLANGYRLETDYVEHGGIYFDKLKNINDYTGYFVVMIYDGGYPTGFDLRGH